MTDMESESDREVLLDGIMPFEVKGLCRKLDDAGVEFDVEGSSCIDPRSNNAAAAITDIYNAFSLYGLKNCYRIVVRHDNLAKAQEVLGVAPCKDNQP